MGSTQSLTHKSSYLPVNEKQKSKIIVSYVGRSGGNGVYGDWLAVNLKTNLVKELQWAKEDRFIHYIFDGNLIAVKRNPFGEPLYGHGGSKSASKQYILKLDGHITDHLGMTEGDVVEQHLNAQEDMIVLKLAPRWEPERYD